MIVEGLYATDCLKIAKSCCDIATDSFIRIHVTFSLQGYVVREPVKRNERSRKYAHMII